MFRRIRIRTRSAIFAHVTPLPSGGSQSIQRAVNATRAAVEGMTVHHCCHTVTREPPMSLFRGMAEAALYCEQLLNSLLHLIRVA